MTQTTLGVDSSMPPPHPKDIRALRVHLGATMDAIAHAAGYLTKRSWWMVEEGMRELPHWRWQLVLEAAESGGLERSELAVRLTRSHAPVEVDHMLWVSAERRLEVAQGIKQLMELFDLTANELSVRCGISFRAMSLVLGGRARKQMTTARLEKVRAVMLELLGQAGEARVAFNQEERLSVQALKAFRKGLRVHQEAAGRWAAPNSVTPSALMSAYECETVRLSNEASSRLAERLHKRYDELRTHEAWRILADPADDALLEERAG